jgi:hypothetical protein
MAAFAANLQQNLSYWLKLEPGSAASERSTRRSPLARIVPADPETHLARCLGRLIRSDRYWPSRGARVRRRHGLPLAADAVAKAPFAPPLPTIKPVTDWAKLAQFPYVDKAGRGDRRAPSRRPCASTPRTRPRAVRQRQASPCCGNPSAGRQGCPIGPFRAAALATAPAVLVKCHRSWLPSIVQPRAHNRRRDRVSHGMNDHIRNLYDCVNGNYAGIGSNAVDRSRKLTWPVAWVG